MINKNIPSFLLAALSSLLLFSCFPLLSLWPLSFIALVPLYFSIRGYSVRKTFLASWTAGAIFYLLLLHWIVFNPAVEGWVRPLLYLGVVLIAGYLSLYLAAALALTKWLENKSRVPFWFWACLAIPAFDYLRTQGLLGFPWGSLGYSLVPWTSAIQMSEYTGIYGLTFWALLINGLIFRMTALLSISKEGKFRQIWKPALGLLLVLSLPPLWGMMRINSVKKTLAAAPKLATAIIQGNIQQGLRWDRAFQQYNFDTYRNLTIKTGSLNPELVIWPETALPFYLRHQPEYFWEMAALSRQIGSRILTGVPDVRFTAENGELYFNSAFFFTPHQGFSGSYDKSHLVPFGERFPFKERIPFLKNVDFGEGEWTPGTDTTVFDLGKGKLSCLICFESIFPEIARHQVQKGSRLLVNITNDGWFGRSGAARQHANMSVLRAVEQRRALARCANSGVSMFALPTGKVLSATELFVQDTIFAELPLLDIQTFYGRHGDVFLLVIITMLTGTTGWTLLSRK
jgi:apolipoprotein N-acyltransferase